MPPMCQYSAGADGMATDWHLVHYTTRAVGGVGMIVVEATAVEPRGRISSQDLGIWNDDHVEGLSLIAETGIRYGAVMGIQLAHAGRKCEVPDETIVAPSPIPFDDDSRTPIELSTEEIAHIVQSFGSAAERAAAAGFQLVEIHAAHGYLINEFLSPLTNHRQDDYGGSTENRVRLLKEVLAAVKRALPANMPVCVRISAEDYLPEGNHPEDLAEMLNLVKSGGIDLVNVSSGAVVNAKIHAYSGFQLRYAEIIRSLTGLPVIAGGLISSPHMAEEVLRNERTDLVYLGRELLRNPYWPLQAAPQVRAETPWPKQYRQSNPIRK